MSISSTKSLRHDHNRKNQQFEFPSTEHVLEMAQLSHLVYLMKHGSDCNATSTATGQPIIPPALNCHFYQHDLHQGTQVLVVSHPVKKYLAVVFAGTDDIRTTVADGDIYLKPFGGGGTDDDPLIAGRVHAGFDNAVFQHGLADELLGIVEQHLQPDYRLFTSGHSLGAADAVLLATDMVLLKEEWNVTSINFGCAKIGNSLWMDAVNNLVPRLQVWRLVLGWDLVPRLPSYPFEHVGHTIQMNGNETKVYYHHNGNATLGFAGVPLTWGATPYIWVPGAMASHRMVKYLEHLQDIQSQFSLEKFETVDDAPIKDDDDFYINPPDDVIMMGGEEDTVLLN